MITRWHQPDAAQAAEATPPPIAARVASGLLGDAALELVGVSRRFGALAALSDVTFNVRSGERRAILGSNGAGKTTLFNAITGDFPPTAGNIRLFGEDVTNLPPHARIRRGLRRTYQISLPFRGLSVGDSLVLACVGATRGRFGLRRQRADDPAQESARRLVRAIQLEFSRAVATLSHGELRQLEIGMALAGSPRLILFDEPAAGLSPAERADLVATLHGLPPHIGYVIIEHDLDIALRVADVVTVMHQGRVFRHGLPDEIEADPDVQRLYLGAKHV